MSQQLLLALIGMFGVAVGGVGSAIVVRRRTRSEAMNLDANAANTITEAAAKLVRMVELDYSRRLTDFEHRLHNMANDLAVARAEAVLAREAEKGCQLRLSSVEVEMAALKAQLASLTTTTKTTVTVVEPTGHTTGEHTITA